MLTIRPIHVNTRTAPAGNTHRHSSKAMSASPVRFGQAGLGESARARLDHLLTQAELRILEPLAPDPGFDKLPVHMRMGAPRGFLGRISLDGREFFLQNYYTFGINSHYVLRSVETVPLKEEGRFKNKTREVPKIALYYEAFSGKLVYSEYRYPDEGDGIGARQADRKNKPVLQTIDIDDRFGSYVGPQDKQLVQLTREFFQMSCPNRRTDRPSEWAQPGSGRVPGRVIKPRRYF